MIYLDYPSAAGGGSGFSFIAFFGEQGADEFGDPPLPVFGPPTTARADFLTYLSGTSAEDFEGFTANSGTPQAVSSTKNGTTCTVKQLRTESDGFGDVVEVEENVLIDDDTIRGRFNTTTSGANWLDLQVRTGDDVSAPSGLWQNRYRTQFSFSIAIAAFGFYGTDFGDFADGRRIMADITDSDSVVTTHEVRDETLIDGSNLIFWGFADGNKTYTKVVIYVEQTTASPAEGLGIDDLVFCTPAYLA